MKRIIAITLLILMSFSLYACKMTGEKSSVKEKKDEIETEVERKDIQEDTQKTEGDKQVTEGIPAKEGEEHPFANQNFIYREWKKGIMQISRETGKRQVYKHKKVWELVYVTEDMLYYKSGGEKKTILYGVPIVKKSESSSEETTELDFENKEEILSEKGGYFGEVYVASDYILYLFRDDDGTVKNKEAAYAVKYTKKTGKKKYFEMESVSDYDISYGEKDRFVFGCEDYWDGGYCCLDINTDEMTYFSTGYYGTTSKDLNPHAGFGENFFYGAGDKKIMVYDMKNKKNSVFFSKEKIKKLCKELAKNVKNGKYQSYYLADMFCYEGKLYIQVQLNWKKEKKYHMNYVMFSVDLTKEKKLLYEEEITGIMQDNSDEVSSWKYMYNSGRFLTIVDDMAILVLNNSEWESGEQQIATYNMKTKELKKVMWWYSGGYYMVGYYLPYSDFTDPYYGTDESYMDIMPDYFD